MDKTDYPMLVILCEELSVCIHVNRVGGAFVLTDIEGLEMIVSPNYLRQLGLELVKLAETKL